MNSIQIIDDMNLVTVDGAGIKADIAIGIGFAVCPLLGLGMAVGYYLNTK